MKSSAVVGLDQAADAVAAPGLSAAAIDVQLSQPFAAPKPDAPVASSAAGVSIGSTFDIVIHYGGDPAYQAAFDAAAARWEQIITGEIPDVNSGIFGLVDDLLIDASVVAIDGPGHVLAQAGPDYFRSGSSLPYHGVMQFDSADMAQMAANGTLTSVILHEMGHVLGIGTIWTSLGLASGYSYTGAHALAEYRTLTGNPGATSVPLETGGGPGTAGGHWSESVFNAELMTGYVETSGTAMPLSRVTIGALQDMGYTVNHGAADPFSLPPSTDDYADNLGDGSAPFGALATAGSATGNIEWTGDHDWFRIELTAGAAYTIAPDSNYLSCARTRFNRFPRTRWLRGIDVIIARGFLGLMAATWLCRLNLSLRSAIFIWQTPQQIGTKEQYLKLAITH